MGDRNPFFGTRFIRVKTGDKKTRNVFFRTKIIILLVLLPLGNPENSGIFHEKSDIFLTRSSYFHDLYHRLHSPVHHLFVGQSPRLKFFLSVYLFSLADAFFHERKSGNGFVFVFQTGSSGPWTLFGGLGPPLLADLFDRPKKGKVDAMRFDTCIPLTKFTQKPK